MDGMMESMCAIYANKIPLITVPDREKITRTRTMDDHELFTVPIDEENEYFVQDQLPSVEDVKTSIASSVAKCRLTKAYWVPIFLLTLTVIGLSIGLTERKSESKTLAKPSPPVPAPTPPLQTPTLFPTPLVSRLDDAIHFLVTNEISNSHDLATNGTPQRKAVYFMADQDPLQLPLSMSGKQFVQRYAVVVIYFALHGRRWPKGLGWLTGDRECNWRINISSSSSTGNSSTLGNVCNAAGELVQLSLFDLGLNGTIPTEIGHLTKLASIDFHNNYIDGTFPSALFQLTELQYIMLQNNNLGGTIPQTGWVNISNLLQLHLDHNSFHGSFPTEWLALSSLTVAQVQFNGLQGRLPSIGWHTWSNMTSLSVGNNKLKGSVPQQLINFVPLLTLSLNGNFFEGNVGIFSNISTSLEALYVQNNDFVGTIGSSLFENLSNLQYLDLSDNRISSELPLSLLTHPKLLVVDLHNNAFYGTIPSPISNKTKLKYLALHNNSLTGPIPSSISKLTGLLHLDVSNNLLDSAIPQSLGNMVNLKNLFLAKNGFITGPIPSSFASLTNLVNLSLQRTNRNGTIPKSLATLRNMSLLDVSDNSLTGKVPISFGQLVSLRYLLLDKNRLSGTLPYTMRNLTNLDMLLLDHNNIIGPYNWLCGNWSSSGRGGAPTYFVADCQGSVGKPSCRCCSRCCLDSNVLCNQTVWLSNLDSIWEYGVNLS